LTSLILRLPRIQEREGIHQHRRLLADAARAGQRRPAEGRGVAAGERPQIYDAPDPRREREPRVLFPALAVDFPATFDVPSELEEGAGPLSEVSGGSEFFASPSAYCSANARLPAAIISIGVRDRIAA
jgi:hypothetical protein